MRKKLRVKLELYRYNLEYCNEPFKDHKLRILNLEIRCVIIDDKKRKELFSILEIPSYELIGILKNINEIESYKIIEDEKMKIERDNWCYKCGKFIQKGKLTIHKKHCRGKGKPVGVV